MRQRKQIQRAVTWVVTVVRTLVSSLRNKAALATTAVAVAIVAAVFWVSSFSPTARMVISVVALLVVIVSVILLGRRGDQAEGGKPSPGNVLISGLTAVGLIVTVLQIPETYHDFFPDKPCEALEARQVDRTELRSVDQHSRPVLEFDPTVQYSLEMGHDKRLQLGATGVIHGSVPKGQSLYLVGSAVEDSVDMFNRAVRGVRYFPAQQLTTGCWRMSPHPIAYVGACGLEFRYFVALVPLRTVEVFARYVKDHAADYIDQNHGFGPKTLTTEFGANLLAYWTVASNVSRACLG